jgi:DNA-binding winged helix-turn-helix (wHTH) protein/Tol biopolymer transport system component
MAFRGAAGYAFGEFRIDLRSRRLLRGEETLPITVKSFDTLAVLVERAGQVVDKEELMRRVWTDAVVEEANLSQQIFTLRRTLGEEPKDHRFIQTVPRRGYRFVAEVRPIFADAEPAAVTRPVLRLSLDLPPDRPLAIGACSPIALSPDGRTLAYVALDGGTPTIVLRSLDRDESVRVARSEGAAMPFFSPDGRWLGYTAHGHIYKALVSGGMPIMVCDAGSECRGASWTAGNEIVFAAGPATGLSIVSADAGSPKAATQLDFAKGERTHRWPDVLPSGRHVLLTVAHAGSASFDEGEIVVASLDTGERHGVAHHGSCARYVPTGHIVYMRGGSLMAVAFDAARLETRGSAIPVADRVMTQPTGAGHFTFSNTGCLLYLTGEAQDVKRRLVWIDRQGSLEPLPLEDQAFEEPRLSPDGARVAFGIRGKSNDIWIHQFASAMLTRVTFDGDNFAPIWTPDGARLTFSSNRNGPCHIFSQDTEGRDVVELVDGDYDLVPGSWSPDGAVLLFTEYNPSTGANVWMCAPGSKTPPRALVRSRANDFGPACAPDGRSFAYTSDETGRFEVYLCPFPEFGTKTQVSVAGGAEPVWAPDGRLCYRNGSSIMAVTIDLAKRERVGLPERIADGPFLPGAVAGLPNYDVGRDGRLLAIAQTAAQAQPDRLSVIVNWFDDIAARLA